MLAGLDEMPGFSENGRVVESLRESRSGLISVDGKLGCPLPTHTGAKSPWFVGAPPRSSVPTNSPCEHSTYAAADHSNGSAKLPGSPSNNGRLLAGKALTQRSAPASTSTANISC